MDRQYDECECAEFSDLVGKTFVQIKGKVGDESLEFICSDGSIYWMEYHDDCCASCNVEDICGDLQDLIGSPVVKAEENSNGGDDKYGDSQTWTFYHISTAKGTVTIRWYGSSNGYYSESPDIYKRK